jgi:K+-sensing histidine kinase KdpD
MAGKSTLFKQIQSNVIFQSVDENLLRQILGSLKKVDYSNDQIIFEDEAEGNCLYLIIKGKVKISKHLKTGDEIVLGILHEGDFFGELDLIDRRQRSARATAIGRCTLVRMDKKEFDLLIRSSSAFTMNLLQMITLRLRSNNLTYVMHEESNLFTLRQQLEKTNQLVEASKIINSSLDIDNLLELIFQTAAKTVGADRGTLYLVDESRNIIWSKIQKGSSKIEIRLPIGVGIAGNVAKTGDIVNIPDAYSDPRFNPKIDQTTGYRTRSTLCMPMKNRDGKIIGVFQLLNKSRGHFTKDDEKFIEAFSTHAAIAIENAKLAQQMIQNERLSAVGKMASTIIHDIKNPMSVLRISAQVMKKKSANLDIAKIADEMVQQIDSFVAMTQEILDFARGISSLNLQSVDFDEIMKTLVLIVEKELLFKKIELIKKFNFSGAISVDPDKLIRVFYNITRNAADAMPNGGKLTINTFSRDSKLVIEFIDNGIGMSDEVKAKIFEPFYTYGKKHGTGLGMAIVKKIIDDHRGNIEIESKVNKGTTVRVSLPV